MFLDSLGANEDLRQLIRFRAERDLELGRICFASHERYSVYLDSGLHDAVPAGRLRWDDELPAVGDWVAVGKAGGSFALIEEVLPRRTQFSRKAAGREVREQVAAANIDLAVIVCGLDGDYNPRRLERYLVLAHESKAGRLIVLNKADLCANAAERLAEVKAIAEGTEVLALCARESVEPLQPLAAGKTIVLLGSSGAGKSTIANRLLGEQKQTIGATRESDSRGRHTTTSRMLIPLPGGGALIDTPGMRELQLWADESSLDNTFAEIAALAEQCRFTDCAHTCEPGCAVLAALDSCALDARRWQSYRKLEGELRYQRRRQDPEALATEKKKWKAIHKAMRHGQKK